MQCPLYCSSILEPKQSKNCSYNKMFMDKILKTGNNLMIKKAKSIKSFGDFQFTFKTHFEREEVETRFYCPCLVNNVIL